MICKVKEIEPLAADGNRTVKCVRCGKVRRVPETSGDRIYLLECESWPQIDDWGEWASDCLAAHCITPGIVSAILGRKCGCEKRKDAINAAGQTFARKLRALFAWKRLQS